MNVLAFDNQFEMKQHLANAAAHGLHPLQEALTWGDYWVQFHDIGKHHLRFGRVLYPAALTDLALDKGCTTEQAADQVKAAEEAQTKGILYCRRYDFWVNPEGVLDVTYKAHVWPIEEALYNAAFEADWYVSKLPTSQQINLQAAFLAWRGHMRSKR